MSIFFEKSDDIGFQEDRFELFRCEPFISDKSLLLARTWLRSSGIAYEKEGDFFMDDRCAFEVSSDKGIGNLVHELDDMEIFFCEASFFGNFTNRCFESTLIFFYVSFREDIFEVIFRIFPCEHEDLDVISDFSIHQTASTLFMEFCHKV